MENPDFIDKLIEFKRSYIAYTEMELNKEYYPGGRMRLLRGAEKRFRKACDELCGAPIPENFYD